ncbi:uncharacterized protein LOC119103472 [Pollicipes pollicipes]|uniref:uncharacterized protein LOC119103472 n=1 Tax=Pollicipes pollicipes TaxID=41117 RepID=UPI001885960A|nr:uncharacterized protein LOC119103472 [Pollicipes pollicipes]
MKLQACCSVAVVVALLSPVRGQGAQVDGLQFSFDDEAHSAEDDVLLLDVKADDRFEYKIENDDGTYQYGYQSGRLGDDGGYNFKHEYKRADGVLFGQHGYELPSGLNHTVNYVADGRGYRVLEDGQEYEPATVQEVERQRSLLGDLSDDWEDQEPLQLDVSLLQRIAKPDSVELEADPAVALSSVPLQPYSQLDPDTGAFRFGYRQLSEDGGVTYRHEERRDDGVVFGQYGHRAAGGPSSLVSYVSDAFGYRLVDPAAPVPVVSREQALRELPQVGQGMEAAFGPEPERTPESEPEPQMKPAPEAAPGLESQAEEVSVAAAASVAESQAQVDSVPAQKLSTQSTSPSASSGTGETGGLAGGVGNEAFSTIDGATSGELSAEMKAAAEVALQAAVGISGGADSVVTEADPFAPRPAPSLIQLLSPQYSHGAPLLTAYVPYYAPGAPYHNPVAYQSSAVHHSGPYLDQQYQLYPYSSWYPHTGLVPATDGYQPYPYADSKGWRVPPVPGLHVPRVRCLVRLTPQAQTRRRHHTHSRLSRPRLPSPTPQGCYDLRRFSQAGGAACRHHCYCFKIVHTKYLAIKK